MTNDELLAKLLTELTDDQRQGKEPDIDAVAKRYPEIAEEFRQLWAASKFADLLGRSAPSEDVAVIEGGRAEPSLGGSPLTFPRLFGDYELLTELGRGGMGVVYKARERSLNRIVALKMILGGELATETELARFHSEARAAGALAHDGIVPVYSVSTHDGQAFYTMQYIEGKTLAQRMGEGLLPAQQAARYLLEITEAVQFAHHKGILHRDLKPSNVLLDEHDRAHVTDFGLAKRIDGSPGTSQFGRLTRTGAIVGTPSYLSPEQALGSRGTVSPASDVYSLGAILYEMLTGKPPFQAASAFDTLLLVVEQEVVPPRVLNPRVERDMELICMKCLQKPSDLRYPSADSLAGDLRAYLAGEPISARTSGLTSFIDRMFRETHHATVLENWGLLWIWHSLATFLLGLFTNVLLWLHVNHPLPYLLIWTVGLCTWAVTFWSLRRRGGPVLFIERQLAHYWAGGVTGTIFVFWIELLLQLPVLTLSPLLAILAGVVFLTKAGTLSGTFYFSSAALFLTSIPMAIFPEVGPLLFGIVSSACFFFPGLKYYRQRRKEKS